MLKLKLMVERASRRIVLYGSEIRSVIRRPPVWNVVIVFLVATFTLSRFDRTLAAGVTFLVFAVKNAVRDATEDIARRHSRSVKEYAEEPIACRRLFHDSISRFESRCGGFLQRETRANASDWREFKRRSDTEANVQRFCAVLCIVHECISARECLFSTRPPVARLTCVHIPLVSHWINRITRATGTHWNALRLKINHQPWRRY